MDFMVFTHDGDMVPYTGDARYSILNGALVVEAEGRTIVYSPAGWVRLEAEGVDTGGGWVVSV